MKKLIAVLLLAFTALTAQGIHWEKDYATALEKAKKLNKPVLFVISRHTCRWCVHLERTTFQDPKVINVLNRDFVNVISYTDEGDYIPRDLYVPGTPTLWFLDSTGEPLFRPVQGAIGAKDMYRATQIVETEFRKVMKKKRYGARP